MAAFINSQEYELATAKSNSTPYIILKGIGNDLSWQEIKKKQKVYSPTVTEVHIASDLHRKK